MPGAAAFQFCSRDFEVVLTVSNHTDEIILANNPHDARELFDVLGID